jgi:hypothetical protein
MTPPQAPAFRLELAPLRNFQPEKIIGKVGEDRTAMFVLALAFAFNDLKGLLLFREAVLPARPSNVGQVAPEPGEWEGIGLQLHRLLVGHLHELLLLIETFADVASGDEFRAILKPAPVKIQREWEGLVRVATGTGSARDATFSKILERIRHNAVYHYYQPKMLVSGYRQHFYVSAPRKANQFAYVSLGKNLQRTRFFYADAAVEGALTELVGTMGTKKFNKVLLEAIKGVKHALQYVVSQYLERAKVP